MKTRNKIVVIGGGAAGFFSAIRSAELNSNAEVIILEKSNKLLSKVIVSGGGRCNVTHDCTDNQELSKNYPRGERELRSIFSKFSVNETIHWFKSKGVELKTESDGRMFPTTDNSETIANCLMDEAERLKIKIIRKQDVQSILKTNDHFTIQTNDAEYKNVDKIICCIGGHPNIQHYSLFKELGHNIKEPIPSLFTFNIKNSNITQLMGLSVIKAIVKLKGTKAENSGPLLITHWGFSGPAVIKLSSIAAKELHEKKYETPVIINWTAKTEQEVREDLDYAKKENSKSKITNTSQFRLPNRLWSFMLEKSQVDKNKNWSDLSKKELNLLINNLVYDEYQMQGKTTFKEEFVTCGGIPLNEIDLKTMESKKCTGLFFAGEVIDVDGVTGGFNFQSAWSTAWVAAAKGIDQ